MVDRSTEGNHPTYAMTLNGTCEEGEEGACVSKSVRLYGEWRMIFGYDYTHETALSAIQSNDYSYSQVSGSLSLAASVSACHLPCCRSRRISARQLFINHLFAVRCQTSEQMSSSDAPATTATATAATAAVPAAATPAPPATAAAPPAAANPTAAAPSAAVAVADVKDKKDDTPADPKAVLAANKKSLEKGLKQVG